MLNQIKEEKKYVGSLEHGKDIISCITDFADKNKIESAYFSIIGALSFAEVSEFNQKTKQYDSPNTYEGNLELLNCTGNISKKEGGIFIHAHVTCSYKENGEIKTVGGHLGKSKIWVAEIYLSSFPGLELKREYNEETKLFLLK